MSIRKGGNFCKKLQKPLELFKGGYVIMLILKKMPMRYKERRNIMKKKTLWKALGVGMLSASLFISPLAGISALAAEGDTEPKEGGSAKALDPTQDKDIPAVGTEGEEGYKPAVPAYADTEIPVWGFTEDALVYSVDVEWGAMTFQWENSSWDPETHMKKTGAGWKVYDSVEEEALDATEDLINEVKVTNHSNAPVWATLTYASEAAYDPDTTGDFSFTTGTETGDTNKLTEKTTDVPAYLALATADNGADGAAGTPTVGKAYFMPDGLATALQTDDGIAKWTKIGNITVGIRTEEPTAPVGP